MNTQPIGMFDSGVGGLTVLKEYMKEMPNENFIYYGDTAHLPYGDKSKETIIEYTKNITDFLMSKDVKMIIIACGTASALSYETLKNEYKIPIQNIITPTAKSIKDEKIGVIATKGTIKSMAWEKEILKYNPNAKIVSKACPLFVPIVEEGFAGSELAKLVVHEYLSTFKEEKITSLVLGCTHYPILENEIKSELGDINILNTGTIAAKETKEFLKNNNLENDSNNIGKEEFYVSDDMESFKENAKKLGIII